MSVPEPRSGNLPAVLLGAEIGRNIRLTIRPARREDLPHIVGMLADDFFAAGREDPADLAPYARAFAEIEANPATRLLVGEDEAGTVVASLQLTFIPSLGNRGFLRAAISGVRVASHLRGVGVGHQLLWWTIAECRRRGCAVIELLSHNSRTDAQHFYETLGFTRSHVGMRLKLRPG
jgi:GNAT superfamily N-acetyltransferase